ncbi:acyl-CoA N-acyltransferase [Hypoxylon trugodes]|uniref:acyl-CoA N-acyltransferase n=1 Tax=Hypoxylon trugodes TaxID=326681 RepID=UPI00218D78A4|nr:acyl-CoA N-acyltransferase [Hypoxylon trugodes]KAI1389229.1 acyl-CoA N-acyltransferase [Hypoxylon trugodes]
MPFAVLPTNSWDVEAIAEVNIAAFEYALGISHTLPRNLSNGLRKQLENTERNIYTVKCVDTDTDRIVGVASWQILWDSQKNEKKSKCQKNLEGLIEIREDAFGGRKHVYLSSLTVHPDYRREQIREFLLEWGIDIADELELPLYVETLENTASFYESMGLEKVTDHAVRFAANDIRTNIDVEIPIFVKMPSIAEGLSFEDWVFEGYPMNYEILKSDDQRNVSDFEGETEDDTESEDDGGDGE